MFTTTSSFFFLLPPFFSLFIFFFFVIRLSSCFFCFFKKTILRRARTFSLSSHDTLPPPYPFPILLHFILQLTRWRGPGQTWRVRGNIFVAQIRSETPPDMFLILPLLCSATDTPIFCTSGNTHIPSHTDTVRVCWKQSIFSKKKKRVEACNATNGRDLIKRNGYIFVTS